MVPSLPVLSMYRLKWVELKRTLPEQLLICEELFEIEEAEPVAQINVLVTHDGCAEGGCGRRVCRVTSCDTDDATPASSVTGRSSAGKVWIGKGRSCFCSPSLSTFM